MQFTFHPPVVVGLTVLLITTSRDEARAEDAALAVGQSQITNMFISRPGTVPHSFVLYLVSGSVGPAGPARMAAWPGPPSEKQD